MPCWLGFQIVDVLGDALVRLPVDRAARNPASDDAGLPKIPTVERVRHVGDRIRSLRKTRGISQEALALESGFGTQSTISRWESGRRVPDLVSLILIADALGVEPMDLMNISDGYRARIIEELRDAPESVLRELFHLLMDWKSRAPSASADG